MIPAHTNSIVTFDANDKTVELETYHAVIGKVYRHLCWIHRLGGLGSPVV